MMIFIGTETLASLLAINIGTKTLVSLLAVREVQCACKLDNLDSNGHISLNGLMLYPFLRQPCARFRLCLTVACRWHVRFFSCLAFLLLAQDPSLLDYSCFLCFLLSCPLLSWTLLSWATALSSASPRANSFTSNLACAYQ